MKKRIKLIGNIITILAVFLIARRILLYDIQWGDLLSAKKLLTICGCAFAYAFLMILNHFPWMKLVGTFSGRTEELKSQRSNFIEVYVKSNLYKYIPGNVFQYVGRNELAVRLEVSHFQVAAATVSEVALTTTAAFLMALILVGPFASDYFLLNWKTFAVIIAMGFSLLLVFLLIVRFSKKPWVEGIRQFFHELKKKNTVITLIKCLGYYMFSHLFSGCIFLLTLQLCGSRTYSANEIKFILGASILSWVAGYLTPGSPGGIGIRELIVSTIIVGTGIVTTGVVTSASVIYRIITILGDLFAFLFVGAKPLVLSLVYGKKQS